MRMRNLKNSGEIIKSSKYIIINPNDYKGKWSLLFGNSNPIHIEIGMGKGKFILENAIKYPDINFIGIERYDSIIAKAIKKIDNYNLNNLKLIKFDALFLLDIFDHEIDTIYLNFSDPWPKERHFKRRLTSHQFLNIYDGIFLDRKNIIMKTDNRKLFEFSIMSFNEYGYLFKNISLDLHSDEENIITTEYEDKFIKENKVIYKIECYKLD